MTEKEAIKILRNIQNAKKVEYEDAACAAAWFSIFKYVYPEPEDIADKIISRIMGE